ncbi:MAG: FKBP-type peptidyl-prolyl cis-trans isomerase [Mucilaginibacter sp.]
MKKFLLIVFFFAAVAIEVRAQNDFTHTPKGALVKKFTNNPGDKIKINDVVTFDVVQKTEKDSVLFSSYQMGHPVKIQIQASQNAGDLMDVLPLLTTKDSAYVKIPTDSVFIGHEQERPPFLPKGSNLVYVIKIERIQSLNDAIAERDSAMASMKTAEKTSLNKYIADNKLVVKTTPSGLKYVITHASVKPKPLQGDTVYVNYTGRTLDGKVFDSSIQSVAQEAGLQQPGRTYEPLKFAVGSGSVIKGWDEGFLLLNEGAKAKLLIPSDLAYGSEGAGQDIPPFSSLIFDVELVKVKRIKHAATPARKTTTVRKKTTTAKSKKKS